MHNHNIQPRIKVTVPQTKKSFLLLVLKPQSGCQSFSNAVNTHALLFAHYVEIVFQKCCAMRVSNKVNCNQRSSKVNVKIAARI